jgi:hypothetical protein
MTEEAIPAEDSGSDPAELETMEALSVDSTSAFSALRTKSVFAPRRALQLGYVSLGGDHPRPKQGVEYKVVTASSEAVGAVAAPTTPFRRAHLDLYEFFIDDLPDFLSKNKEGLLKVQVSTKNPQDLDGSMFDAAFATEFRGRDGSYAPSFLYRGVFRNVLLQDWINLKFELYELDTDASEYYAKIKGVIDKIPEVKNLDVLKGIPYLNLATQLFDGIITTFGRNPDDHLWGELPIMEVEPTPGGAFLRTGIYVLMEKVNSRKEDVLFEDLVYKDGRVLHASGKRLTNHLVFGLSLVEHVKA